MHRSLSEFACAIGVSLALVGVARADDAAKVKQAAAAFAAGAQAYEDGQWELAASRFEEAHDAAPNSRALRQAIRSRDKAGQAARAATLAALAQSLYASEASTQELANEVMGRLAPGLHRLDVTCATACVLAVGSHLVHGPAAEKAVVFVNPGRVTLSASFDGGGADEQILEARAGASNAVRLESRSGAPHPSEPPPPSKPSGSPAPSPEPPPVAPGDESAPDTGESSGVHPAVFVVALGGTLAVGGAIIWSGLDATNNPGTEVVREACRGQGTDCPEYQDGLSRQLRTNALIGVTAGLGAVTVVLAGLTDWDGSAPSEVQAAFAAGPGGAFATLTTGF